MKKSLLIVAVLAVLFGAGSVWANTDWYGEFWGDSSKGEWKGTLYDDIRPPHFDGKWSDGHDAGKCYAELEYAGHGIYKITKGTLYNSKGYEIGKFDGYFNLNIKPGKAEGEWKTLWGEYGKWQGKRVLL